MSSFWGWVLGVRAVVDGWVAPFLRILSRRGLTAEDLTWLSALPACGLVLYARSNPSLAILCFVLFELASYLDGALARATNTESDRGVRLSQFILRFTAVGLAASAFDYEGLVPVLLAAYIVFAGGFQYGLVSSLKRPLPEGVTSFLRGVYGLGFTPNRVTLVAAFFGLAGVWGFWNLRLDLMLACFLLYFGFDALDGMIARAAGVASRRGRFLDFGVDALVAAAWAVSFGLEVGNSFFVAAGCLAAVASVSSFANSCRAGT
ncbi:CDP-alcohol phosphatidyltransferase [uncultured archaeon]|nr:CDP-alcohol phosphatidyltransferase [uncultured archaeon]